MAIELGVAYLSVLPDVSKISSGVVRAMGAAGKSGGKAFTGGVDSSLGGMAKSFGAAGKNAGEALAKSALSAAKSDIAKLSKSMASATDAQAAALGRLRVAQAKLAEVQGSAKPKASALAAAEEAVATAQRKATATSETAKAATDKLTAANGRAKTAAEQVAKAQASAAQSGAGTGSRFTRAFKSAFTADPGQALKVDGGPEGSAAGRRFGNGFKTSLGIVSRAGGGLIAALGIGKLATDSVGLEATFSQTMNTMAAVANVPADQIKTLSALAIKMGADTTFSASEASGAMLELAKGGLSAATIASGGLQGTLTLAAAGGTDLATASTIASNALNTFGLKGKDMASIAAALAGGANASTASVESLGFALSQVGPGAKTAGLSLQETVAVLSSFDAAGIKGNDAGTSLKTMLTRLVPATDKAKGTMEELGLKFTDAHGAFVPITNVAQQLHDKLGKLTAEQKTSTLATLFGSDATRAATVLMNLGSKGLTTYIKATQDQGAAEKVAAARMSGTAGAWESFKGSVETAKLQLGLFLAPAVQAGLKKITDGVNNIVPGVKALAALLVKGDFTGAFAKIFHVQEDSGLVNALLTLRDTVISLAGFVTGTLLPAVKGILGFMKDNTGIVIGLGVAYAALVVVTKAHAAAMAVQTAGGVASWLGNYAKNIKIVQIATKTWAAVQWLLNAAMAANPFTLIVIAIIALVVVIAILWKKNDAFRNALITAWSAIKTAAVAVFDGVKTAVSAVINFVRDHWKLILGIIGGPFVAIVLLVATYWGQIKAGFMAGVNAVVGALKTAWGAIVGVFSGPVMAVVGVLQAIWSRIYPILVLPFYIAKALIGAVFAGIVVVFTAAKNWVVGAFSAAWNAVAGVLAGPINTARGQIAATWSAIGRAFTAAKDWVINAFSKAWAAVSGILGGPINSAKDFIATRIANIRANFSAAKDWVLGAFSKAWGGLTAKLTGPINTAKTAVTTALGAGKGGIQWVFSQAVAAVGRIWDGLQELAKKPIRFIVNTVLNEGLIDGFNWIAKKFDAPEITHIPLPQGFAAGGKFSGRLPGPPSPVDNMFGMTAAGPVGLATGEFIVNAKDTARNLPLLQRINNGMGFADGGLFGKLKGAVGAAFNAGKSFGSDAAGFLKDPVRWFKDKFAGPLSSMRSLGDSSVVQIAKAIPDSIANTITTKAKDLLSGLTGGAATSTPGGGSGVERWRPVALSALAAAGGSASWINSLLRRMNQESGGNPQAINLGDSNARAGHPSQGLMQTIPGTFAAYAGPYRSRGITDPFANIYAAIKYTIARYGSGPAGWDRAGGYANGGMVLPKATSYDAGGMLPTGYSFVHNGTGAPEPVGHDVLRRGDLNGLRIQLDAPGVGTLTGHIRLVAQDEIGASNEFASRTGRMHG